MLNKIVTLLFSKLGRTGYTIDSSISTFNLLIIIMGTIIQLLR